MDGELQELRYEWPNKEQVMVQTGQKSLKKNQVCYINGNWIYYFNYVYYFLKKFKKVKYNDLDSIGLHRVENKLHDKIGITLHIYVPALKECHGFDENTGKSSLNKVTFTSRYGLLNDS